MNEPLPIITANFHPLRFVLRGEQDAWSPTLQQINSRDYDYVRLHRMSTYLDVGISPFSLGICFDGTLVLPALPKYLDIQNTLTLINTTLAELLLGGLYCEAVAPEDIGYGSLSFTSYARTLGGGPGAAASFHRAARSKYLGELEVLSLLKPEVVSVDALLKALSFGRDLLKKLGSISLEQVLYGATFYVKMQWAESLIHIWTVTERIVELAWHKHVVLHGSTPSKQRRSFLEDHRSWPVSTKLEVLFQKNLVPIETLTTLDEVRKARNEFAHRGRAPNRDTATKALKGCFQLASLAASNFREISLFKQVIDLVQERSEPTPFPRHAASHILKTTPATLEKFRTGLWLAVPPIPGDVSWGDKAYEVIDELKLKPIKYVPKK